MKPGQFLPINNLRKAIAYSKKNGLLPTYFTLLERFVPDSYSKRIASHDLYQESTLPREICESQKEQSGFFPYLFSILVPAFETKPSYLRAMVDSVLAQTYGNFELIIVDASQSDQVDKEIQTYSDKRIQYYKKQVNEGISDNSNVGLGHASGEYIGLLDHDDLLTPNALFEMAKAIHSTESQGITPVLLYSDEVKTDGEGKKLFDPHYKLDFNKDLFLSNNYMCHFTVIRLAECKAARFRKAYDGAQDYDLFLRVIQKHKPEQIVHVPQILYKWRCHEASTAQNPQSKLYAYEAGKRAVEDFLQREGIPAKVSHSKHLGFYRVTYNNGILKDRSDVGAVGGPVYQHKKVLGGAYEENGTPIYQGLYQYFSGYMKRAILQQQAAAVDIRNMEVKEEFLSSYKEALENMPKNPKEKDFIKTSLNLCRKIKEKGYCIVYDPQLEK